MLWKCCTRYASKSGKLSSGYRTGKGQFSFQSQGRAMPKNVQTYHTITFISHASKVMLKILQARLQQYVNHELPDVQAGFKKEEAEIKLPTSVRSFKKQENSRKTSASLTTLKSLCRSQQTVENSSRDGNTRLPYLPPEKSVSRSLSNS